MKHAYEWHRHTSRANTDCIVCACDLRPRRAHMVLYDRFMNCDRKSIAFYYYCVSCGKKARAEQEQKVTAMSDEVKTTIILKSADDREIIRSTTLGRLLVKDLGRVAGLLYCAATEQAICGPIAVDRLVRHRSGDYTGSVLGVAVRIQVVQIMHGRYGVCVL